jgi:hypothetical protein
MVSKYREQQMVLICNNNTLTIDQFHKNRCEEKNQIIKNIIVNRKYCKQTSESEPEPDPEQKRNTSYSDCIQKYFDIDPAITIKINLPVNKR